MPSSLTASSASPSPAAGYGTKTDWAASSSLPGRPKTAHWLAAYQLISATVTPHPASVWAKGPEALPLAGPPRGLTDQVLDDEFPLSMFYEALEKKMRPVIESTSGITGASAL